MFLCSVKSIDNNKKKTFLKTQFELGQVVIHIIGDNEIIKKYFQELVKIYSNCFTYHMSIISVTSQTS
jgi:2C-methyl-D-erythritol 2,4-cyclodiphosphate synthase